ncbi:MAG: FHA domain-containing protein, partial [Myxococcota bacterium]
IGATSPEALSALVRSYRPSVSVSTLGFGEHHNEDIMLTMAQAGGGQYHFIPEPAVCSLEFARALGAQGDVLLDGVEVVLSPEPGVEVSRVLGGATTRVSSRGLVVQLPDLANGAQQLLVAELRVRAQDGSGSMPLLGCTLHYQDAARERRSVLERKVAIAVRESPGALRGEVWSEVLLVRTDEARSQARGMADRGQFDGAAALLRRMIAEIESCPGFVSGDATPLSEACELLLDEAMAMERNPSVEDYKNFKRHSLSVALSSGGAKVSDDVSRSATSQAMLGAVYGDVPTAELHIMDGRQAGEQLALQADQVLGRTPSADVVIQDASVSRRHSRIVAMEGGFHVMDLGSTNVTLLNGEQLTKAQPLRSGDVVQVGSVRLRYVERKPDLEP